ncbi:hypothetical protein T552_03197 [Pneumocystis carinii B80]|uniref:Uncharacterized protein n=1 Tax=Pneumocystis carinii (strain B80) TaxID=1408658 RepID=A0A0W4ZC76_PNEC8|nr:hypothetical protein T552_03197 [Pneumocystis carinii B80]KTW25923.1 hypothetical protein T552_03197 [Pneumocystis carinii B80]
MYSDSESQKNPGYLAEFGQKSSQNRHFLRRSFSQISDKVEHEEQSRDTDSNILHLISPHQQMRVNEEEDIEKEKIYLMKQLQKTKDEIEKYRREIYSLEMDRNGGEGQSYKNMDDLVDSLLNSNNYFLENQSDPRIVADDTMISALPLSVENPIPQLRIFNQLNFHDTSNRIVSSEEHGHLIREHCLKGDCYNGHIFFDIKMLVDEGTLTVTFLNVKVSPWTYPELHEFLSLMMQERNVNNVFYGISSYSKLSTIRCDLFSRLSTKYSQLLSYDDYTLKMNKRLPEEFFGVQYLHFVHENGFELILNWKIKIDHITADASSDISALPRYPESWDLFDETNVLKKMNHMFQKMIKYKGIYIACILLLSSLFHVDSSYS